MSYVMGDILEARIICRLNNQIAVNVLHGEVTTVSGTGCSELQMARGFADHFRTAYAALMTGTAEYRGAGTKKILPTPATLEVLSAPTAGSAFGTAGGDPLPLQVSGLVGFTTPLPGRHGRGRTYVPFPSEADNGASGHPSSTGPANYVARLNDLANLMLAVVIGSGGAGNSIEVTLGVLDRTAGTISFNTAAAGRGGWATQRRRGDFGAGNVSPI